MQEKLVPMRINVMDGNGASLALLSNRASLKLLQLARRDHRTLQHVLDIALRAGVRKAKRRQMRSA